jgi:hypothetical protein
MVALWNLIARRATEVVVTHDEHFGSHVLTTGVALTQLMIDDDSSLF